MKKLHVCILLLLLLGTTAPLFAQIGISLETGAVFTGYNDAAIPGDTGTRFSLKDDLSTDPRMYFRLRGMFSFFKRHHISFLYAPLNLTAEGTADRDIVFRGYTYPAGTKLKARYRFNSYRLTYRYDIFLLRSWEIGLGLTGKIREAHIRLKGNGISNGLDNVGFVPLIHFRVRYLMTDSFSLLIAGDALAAPQGRAEDILFALRYDILKDLSVYIGYRLLEGGSNSDTVYTFSMLHYVAFGISARY